MVKEVFFYTKDNSVTNILPLSLKQSKNTSDKRKHKKSKGGVNFFHFLRIQNPYVQNFGFGTGVEEGG